MAIITIEGKEVDTDTLVVDGIDMKDYPDFCDAYFEKGFFADGTELTEDQLSWLAEHHGDLLHEKIERKLH